VDAPFRRVASVVAVAAGVLATVAAVPASGGTDSGHAAELRREGAALERWSRSAVLELYAIESRLDETRARFAGLRARADAVERKRVAVQRHLRATRATLRAAERLLAGRLRALYETGEADPLAVVFGAESVEEALTTLDGLAFAAEQDRAIIAQARTARSRLGQLSAALRARGAELARLARAAESEAASLERTRTERAAYVAHLAAQRESNAARLAAVEAAAAAAAARARTLVAVATSPAVASSPEVASSPAVATGSTTPTVSAGGTTLTVSASGYALDGGTATGVPVGWGVAAVDPSVIPLGTRFMVPGYGSAIAADTGVAVVGSAIDLWFPTEGEALAWGRRTVTIALL
jgi:3D (Asp-Asp-Asp) domain-containing protein